MTQYLLMNKHKLGTVCVADEKLHLQGIFTDGDLRRIFLKIQKPLSAILIDDISIYMNKNPLKLNFEDCSSKEDIKLIMKKIRYGIYLSLKKIFCMASYIYII